MKVTLIAFITCALIASVFGNEDENKDYCPNEKKGLNPGTCAFTTCSCALLETYYDAYICAPSGGGTCACSAPSAQASTATCSVTPGGAPSANIDQAICALTSYHAITDYTISYNLLQASDFNIFVADLTSLLIQILAELSSPKCDQKHGGEKYAIHAQPV